MSGGFFNYRQDCITDIADSIEALVENNGRTRSELHESGIDEVGDWYTRDVDWWSSEEMLARLSYWRGRESTAETRKWIMEHNQEKVVDFEPETIKEFKKALKLLRKAYVYVQRIDWLLSCDDCEENFHERLKKELEALKKKRS